MQSSEQDALRQVCPRVAVIKVEGDPRFHVYLGHNPLQITRIRTAAQQRPGQQAMCSTVTGRDGDSAAA
jgi:hypothetical protein